MNISKMMNLESERRINPRFECVGARRCSVLLEDNGEQAYLTNLSRNGLSLESPRSIDPEQVYQARISDFNSDRGIPCEIKVVWVRGEDGSQKYIAGASIVRMDPSDKMDLLDVLYEDWKKEVLKKD